MFKYSKMLTVALFLLLVGSLFLVSCNNKKDSSSGECQHEYANWQETKSPTCYNEGTSTRSCSKCNETESKILPASHNWRVTLPNTSASVQGPLTESFCTVCNLVGLQMLDVNEDYDNDGITNGDEYDMGSNYIVADTDGDGLSDGEEFYKHTTDPLLADTDGDGANDKKEIELGFNPKTPNSSFVITELPIIDEGTQADTVKPAIDIEVSGEQLNSLSIKRNYSFRNDTMGYIGDAYDYNVEGDISSATIGFTFDSSTIDESALPTIYAYDEKQGTMTPVATTIEGNVATAVVSKLSTFILLDRMIYENELKWIDVWGVGKIYTDIEIIFVVDDSGSMTSNDKYYERLNVAKNLIEKLPDGSKMGVVEFDSSTRIHTSPLTTDKAQASSYLSTSYFSSSGNTYMYEAIRSALNLFESKSGTTMKVLVVLSDGEATTTNLHTSVITSAKAADVHIYTVGLGSSSSSYFNNYLKPLAANTGGNFYLSSNANELAKIYDDIGEKIDLTTDSDNDGLSDYYEDNAVKFDGISFATDKSNPDSDGDGLLDGQEVSTIVIYNSTGDKMTIIGKVYSDPTHPDSDGDGVPDKVDKEPLNHNVS